jgi:Protein of unknown function (DUF1553)/Protein of unknown function (DUF1549)/Planctomycete cytochrome C
VAVSRQHPWLCLLIGASLLAPCATAAEKPSSEEIEHFEAKIRPVLAGTCAKCHGHEKASGGLRVDSLEALVAGGEHGPALVLGRPDESLLIRAIRHTDDEVAMPPDAELATHVVDEFARWVEHGAPWPDQPAGAKDPFAAATHWAYQPLEKVAPPDFGDGEATPIDRFIRARLRDEGLASVARADRGVRLRRAYFDLLGLPPSPAEIDDFLADETADAWPRLIERLLASPHYGERWGRHWLDVVRYADTAGDNADYPVPEARLYRDYVLDAFHRDKPYDQFLREQLSGDILAAERPADDPARNEQIVATGYLALARRYATAPYELWHLTLEDAIDTTGRAFLGLSLRCARCHDHKYDPVTQADYYALYGIFASTQFPWAGGEEFQSKKFPREHFAPLLPAAEVERHAAELKADISAREAELAALGESADEEQKKKLRKEIERLRRLEQLGLPPGVPCAYAVHEGKPADVCLQLRGEPENPGSVVPRGVPQFLAGENPPAIPSSASGRRELAEWLTSPEHPLTANRVWQWHFGRGLVATTSDFGLRGAPPTNRELLDWLAARLIDSGWSIKALHREIMLSETYQLASEAVTDEEQANLARDPDNLYHWRYDRRRLDAESLRDALLAASARLDLARPGEQPFPHVEDWHWTQHAPFKAVYDSTHRSVYLMTQRLARHPYLALFDGPDPNTSTGTRTSAIVPSQALYLLNNPFVSEQAAGLAERLMAATPDAAARVELACQLCWSRRPDAEESQQALAYIARLSDALAATDLDPARIEAEAWTSYARVLFASHEFSYVD